MSVEIKVPTIKVGLGSGSGSKPKPQEKPVIERTLEGGFPWVF